ncbi:unnamed protein product [Prunus armeniaca]
MWWKTSQSTPQRAKNCLTLPFPSVFLKFRYERYCSSPPKFQNSSSSHLLLFIAPVFGLPSPPPATPSDEMDIKRTSTLSSTTLTSQPLPTVVWITEKSKKLADFYPKSPLLVRAIPSTIFFDPGGMYIIIPLILPERDDSCSAYKSALQEQLMDTGTAVEASPPTFSSSSSSSSCSLDDETYDVFLSFRGEDTRKTFTDHLYWRLKYARVDVFIDENELRGGEIIPDELNQIIQRSRISVIIFSRRYADSIWCLEELEKIMECRRTLGQIVLPIFYDVDPSDVREQTGSFAEAFQTHEVRSHGVKDKEEKIQSWRKSLTEAADLDGLVFSKIDG